MLNTETMPSVKREPFLKTASKAFPRVRKAMAENAGAVLTPFVEESYRIKSLECRIGGESVYIPERIHFNGLDEVNPLADHKSSLAIQCLCSRSTNGYLRQASLRCILEADQPWIIPFVVLLSGEYVVEITEDLASSISSRNREGYANFVRENRGVMRRLRSKATSYWNVYYRGSYPTRSVYPGLVFLGELDRWAS